MMTLDKPIWVLLYLIDAEEWWPNEGPHEPRFFPDVHTYCFDTEKEAYDHLKTRLRPQAYKISKTYLQNNH